MKLFYISLILWALSIVGIVVAITAKSLFWLSIGSSSLILLTYLIAIMLFAWGISGIVNDIKKRVIRKELKKQQNTQINNLELNYHDHRSIELEATRPLS